MAIKKLVKDIGSRFLNAPKTGSVKLYKTIYNSIDATVQNQLSYTALDNEGFSVIDTRTIDVGGAIPCDMQTDGKNLYITCSDGSILSIPNSNIQLDNWTYNIPGIISIGQNTSCCDGNLLFIGVTRDSGGAKESIISLYPNMTLGPVYDSLVNVTASISSNGKNIIQICSNSTINVFDATDLSILDSDTDMSIAGYSSVAVSGNFFYYAFYDGMDLMVKYNTIGLTNINSTSGMSSIGAQNTVVTDGNFVFASGHMQKIYAFLAGLDGLFWEIELFGREILKMFVDDKYLYVILKSDLSYPVNMELLVIRKHDGSITHYEEYSTESVGHCCSDNEHMYFVREDVSGVGDFILSKFKIRKYSTLNFKSSNSDEQRKPNYFPVLPT